MNCHTFFQSIPSNSGSSKVIEIEATIATKRTNKNFESDYDGNFWKYFLLKYLIFYMF